MKRKHNPGVWVLYFALFALPLFGLGQLAIKSLVDRRWAFTYLFFYLLRFPFLLVLISLLSLRKYLRERGVPMETSFAIRWMAIGMTSVSVILLVLSLLPIPGQSILTMDLPFRIASRDDLKANPWGWGREGAEGEGPELGKGEPQNKDGGKQDGKGPDEGGEHGDKQNEGKQRGDNAKGDNAKSDNANGAPKEGNKTNEPGKQNGDKESDDGEPQRENDKREKSDAEDTNSKKNSDPNPARKPNDPKQDKPADAQQPPRNHEEKNDDPQNAKQQQQQQQPQDKLKQPNQAEQPPPPPAQPKTNFRFNGIGRQWCNG